MKAERVFHDGAAGWAAVSACGVRKGIRATQAHLLVGAWCCLVAVAPLGAQARSRVPPPPTTPPQPGIPSVPFARLLSVEKPDLEVGVEDEEGPYLFGMISDVAVGGDGTLYVADYSTGNIRAFDARGRHLTTFGRRGRGPGEFTNPLFLLHDGDSTLYAIQSYGGNAILTARGARIVLRHTFAPAQHYQSACVLGGELIVAGWRDGRMLHVLRPTGEIVQSFGDGWSTDTIGIVREQANRAGGAVTCHEASGRVVIMEGGGARLRAYDRDGRLAWETTLPDFRHTQYVRDGARSVSMRFAEDAASRAMPLGTDRLLVLVTRRDFARAPRTSRASGFVDPAIVSRAAYVLDAATGRIRSRSSNAPNLTIVRDGVAFQIEKEPFPVVRRLRVTPVLR